MRRLVLSTLAVFAVAFLVVAGFARLACAPGALLVDGERPYVDEFVPPEETVVGNDLTRLYLPHHLRIGGWLARAGHVPGWDPAGFGGRPLMGNPQAGLWYPPVWIVWGTRWPAAFGWLTVVHLVWGGLGAFWLGRWWGQSRLAAVVTAAVFALSPLLLAHVAEGHMPHVWSVCWYPWVFLALVRAIRGSALAGVAAVPALALAVLAGHVQEVYYLLLAVAFWACGELVLMVRARERRRALRLVIIGGCVLGLTVGLTTIEWLPTSVQAQWLLRSRPPTLADASRYFVHGMNLFQLVSPRALGGAADYLGFDNYWETVLTLGWVPLMLALVAARRCREARGLVLLGVGAVVFAGGRQLGLFALLYQVVPGMGRFRVPARGLFVTVLTGAVLAGLGLDRLRFFSSEEWAAFERSYRRLVIALVLVVGCGAVLAAINGLGPILPERTYDTLHRLRGPSSNVRIQVACVRLVEEPMVWVTLIGLGAFLLWGRLQPARRGLVVAGVAALGIGELLSYSIRDLPISPAARFVARDPITAELEQQAPVRPFRVRARDAYYPDLPAVVHGIEKTNINDLFQLQHAAELYERLYPLLMPSDEIEQRDPNWWARDRAIALAVLDRMNVAFVVSDRPVPEIPWPVAKSGDWRDATYQILQNPAVLPRAYVVPGVAIWFDDGTLVTRFPFVAPRKAVIMPSDPLLGVKGPRQGFTPASYEATDPDRALVRVTTTAPGLLVVADTWMPGWRATLDGQEVPLLRGNRAQRVVVLDRPGPHEVVMTYRPPALNVGVVSTAAAAFLWVGALVAVGYVRVMRWRRRGRTQPEASRPALASEPAAGLE